MQDSWSFGAHCIEVVQCLQIFQRIPGIKITVPDVSVQEVSNEEVLDVKLPRIRVSYMFNRYRGLRGKHEIGKRGRKHKIRVLLENLLSPGYRDSMDASNLIKT